MKNLAGRYWFLLLLLATLASGHVLSQQFSLPGAVSKFKDAVVAAVMLASALSLTLDQVTKQLQRPAGPLIACVVNLAIVPTLCFAGAWTLESTSFWGLVAVAASPCTLASAVVWTRKAGGNETLALLVTVATNLLCFISAPLVVGLMVGQSIDLPTEKLVPRLVMLVVVPIVIAQMLRRRERVSAWADAHRSSLAVFSQIGILIVVLISAFRLGETTRSGVEFDVWRLLPVVLTVALVHVAALAIGWALATMAGLPRNDRSAVAISGSQKTLMVGLVICSDLGLTLLPIVAYHTCQLLLDTLFAQIICPPRLHRPSPKQEG